MVASGWAVAYRKYSLDYVADEERAQALGTHHVDGERTVEPARQVAGVAGRQIVAARQHRHASASAGGEFENAIGE